MPTTAPSLVLATPCYGGLVHMTYTQSLLTLQPACVERGLPLTLDLGGGEALIGRARAGMMARFLSGAATHLLFADADVGFAPDDVFRLLEADREVVGGLYPRKALDARALSRDDSLAGAMRPEAEAFPGGGREDGGLRSMAALGTGFLMISRAAAQRMVEGYPRLRSKLGDVQGSDVSEATMVFDSFVDPDNGRYLTDYEAFCRRWRDLGGEVWADPRVRVSHVAEVTLRL